MRHDDITWCLAITKGLNRKCGSVFNCSHCFDCVSCYLSQNNVLVKITRHSQNNSKELEQDPSIFCSAYRRNLESIPTHRAHYGQFMRWQSTCVFFLALGRKPENPKEKNKILIQNNNLSQTSKILIQNNDVLNQNKKIYTYKITTSC